MSGEPVSGAENVGGAAASGERAPRLLIIDDIFDNRAVLARRFQRRGYEVAEAESGALGLELIARESFDVVLLDWMMPDMDGPEVLSRLRQQHSTESLPVIMVTAKTQSEDVVQALNAGANDYISKPVDFAVALARVQTQVGRKQAEEKVRQANDALSRANDGLERLVSERTAELRVAMEEAQAANRAKDEFLANMSHELRTPLNGVIGLAQMLATTDLAGPQREMVDIINVSADSLQTIVSDLLDVVDMTSGSIELAPEIVALGDVIREAAAKWSPAAAKKGLSFRLEIAPAADGQVEVDPGRLRQVLGNLLSNAVKFTAQGEVALTAARSPAASDMVILEVRDTGVGFEPGAVARLFSRFEQADNSLTRRFGGVGLGLAICRELVQQMGGTITADGAAGEGAVFRVELPLPQLGSASAPAQPADGDTRPVRVLCVEDHPMNRKVIEFIMTVAGMDMTAVENGAEAVEAYRASEFDIVLMDIQMPVMDGLDATRAIRAHESLNGRAPTPIVMVSAHSFPEHVNASRAAGADRHLAKPVNATELITLIRELLERPQGAALQQSA